MFSFFFSKLTNIIIAGIHFVPGSFVIERVEGPRNRAVNERFIGWRVVGAVGVGMGTYLPIREYLDGEEEETAAPSAVVLYSPSRNAQDPVWKPRRNNPRSAVCSSIA